MSQAATATENRFPAQIKYIVGNEACERFSYYGMRAILVVFMTQYLKMEENIAGAAYHYFASACYLLPLLGAWLSDRFLGKYKTIMLLSIVYCLGHGVLAIWENQMGMYFGLGLIALGSGGIKPCVSAHVGDQFNEKNSHLVKKVFDVFYWSINFGAFFSTLLTPVLLKTHGPGWAFGVPGILMALATWVFWLGRKHYVHVPPTGKTGQAGFVPILIYALRNQSSRKEGQEFFDVARAKFTAEEVEGAKAASSIFKLFILISVFWALFDQHGSSWVLQAEKMDRNVFGMQLESSQIGALNPIMVMVLIPIFAFGIYPAIEKLGFKMTPLRKMSAGMLMTAFSFVVVAMLQFALDAGQTVNVAWQFIPYLIITMAEVMISITGLEFAYTQAPRAMKSTIMSFWLLTVFVGNLITAYVTQINQFQGGYFFLFFAGLMFAVAVVFAFGASRYKVRDFLEKAGAPGMAPAEA